MHKSIVCYKVNLFEKPSINQGYYEYLNRHVIHRAFILINPFYFSQKPLPYTSLESLEIRRSSTFKR